MADWHDEEEKHLSAFLESFPTYQLHSKPGPFSDRLWVFSNKDEGYENNSCSSDDVGTQMMIYDKIESAFSKMDNFHYGTIVQLWAPVTISGKHLLSTSGQPFAVSNLMSSLENYRRCCVEEYGYDIDVNSNNSKFRGTPASAFLNRFPEIASMDPSVNHEVDALLRYAFQECSLTTSYMMPICCPSQTSSSSDCIGVIECSSMLIDVKLFHQMNEKIKEVDLSVYNVQDRIPYKTINGLKLARDQIQEALKIVCQPHHITLVQVWIASLDENHVHFSSSWEEAQTSRLLGIRLIGYNSNDEDSASYCWRYHDACDLFPIQPGQQLVIETLQDNKPRFCKNISHLGTYKLMGCGSSPADDGISSLTICMRSIHTGDLNYVFEFLWNHDSFILLEELLLSIKRCLPSFKFASGTEIGDKLHVIEVDSLTGKENKKFDIFRAKRLSRIPKALKEGKKQVALDYIAPLDTNCKTAPVLVPQQVIEQQFRIEDFLVNICGNGNLMADHDDERLSETMNKGKKAMIVNYNARSKKKRDTREIVLSREDIEQHYGKTMKEAAKELRVSLSTLKRKLAKLGMSGWQGPDLPQRKAYKSNKNQSKGSHAHEKVNGVIQDPSPVKRNKNTVIKAELADDIIKLKENICGNGILMADRETLPTYILHKKPEIKGALWVFCSKDEGSQKNLSSDDLGTRMICDKIKSAFSKVKNDGELIVQFWAPVTSGNRRVLSTSGQPFAVSDFGKGLEEYRGRCMRYECNIDMNNNNKVLEDEIEQHGDCHPMTMINGPPINAFLNRLPEVVLDTKNYRESSLMQYASDCGLWTSYTLPIGCPSQYHSSCIGVVECSSISSINLEIVNTMKRALEQEGLNVFNVQDRIPYNAINGLTLVRDEIQVALKSACESHKIGVAQVWISYKDENHVPFSFSSEDTQTTRRLALKLTGYNSVDEDSTACHWRFKEYCDACDMVPLKMGDELVEKTLRDNKPRFCENISQLGTDTLMAWVSTDDVACSGFTICMSIGTGDFNCAFEFIWHHNPNYVLFLEALLLMLKRCLPRFSFASGAELGDQLHVVDVDNSTESETKFFKIFKEKRLSPIPEAMNKGKKAIVVNCNALSKRKHDTTEIKLSREDIEQHYGMTMKKAAEELGVGLSTLKRKRQKLGMSEWLGPLQPRQTYNNPNKNQGNESQTHQKVTGVIQDPSPVKRNENTVIKAEYADDKIILHLPISEATFVTVVNEIGRRFMLKDGTFKIKFLDKDEDWILMTSDQDLSYCIQDSRNVDRSAVQLRVFLHNQ